MKQAYQNQEAHMELRHNIRPEQAVPPYEVLMEMLQAEKYADAVTLWMEYCCSCRSCAQQGLPNPSPNYFCANILHANLLVESMRNTQPEYEPLHHYAQQLIAWLESHGEDSEQQSG